MELARDAAIGAPEAAAWAEVQLGKLDFSVGRLAAAEAHARTALRLFPGYVYGLDALAQVETARGRYRAAIVLERRAVAQVPLPQFVGTLADLDRAVGDTEDARRQTALIGAIQRLLRANGVRTELETALFDLDHGIRPRAAVALAVAARRARPSIDGDDVLAWALERNGRCAEARRYSERALRLGTRDALKLFHRAAIERCLGRRLGARVWARRARELNPHFSLLWAPTARRLAQ
jgi:tetratricopeptide (TPR) repeat protein